VAKGIGLLLSAVALALAPPALAQRVLAEGQVTVSNGRHFGAVMRFDGVADASYDQLRTDGRQHHVIDTAGAWVEQDGKREALPEGFARWILGHQFHAQLLHFDELNGGSTRRVGAENGCACDELVGRAGAPSIGIDRFVLVVDQKTGRARKLLVERAGDKPIVASFEDWRESGGRVLPFRVRLDDAKDIYDFRFDRVVVNDAK